MTDEVNNDELTRVAENYLSLSSGNVDYFNHYRRLDQRLGQAFFNALNVDDQDVIRGSRHDTFYDDSKIPEVIDLLSKLHHYGAMG